MPRRILFITRSLTPAHGGMQEYVRILLPTLTARGDIQIVLRSHDSGNRWTLPFFFLRAVFTILFFRGHAVHCGDAVLSSLLHIARVFRPSLRRSVTVYGLDLVYPLPLYQCLIRWSLPCAHRVVAISWATAREAQARGVKSENIIVIPCGIDAPPPVSRSHISGPSLLLLGRQIPRKGTEWFIRAVVPRLLSVYPSLRVHVAGDGTELKNIRETVAQLSLGSVVSVLGSVSKERRESLFASSSLFVMPNIPLPGDMEGFGIVCIEAAGRGVPVVAADLEGITDAVIPEETGLLFRPHEVDHAAMTIVEALRRDWDPEQVRSSCLKHFDIQIIASRYVEHVFR